MKRSIAATVAGVALAVSAGCSSGTAGSDGGTVGKISMWHGYTDAEATAIKSLAAQWNAAHPKQTVELVFNGGNDNALTKTLASFVSGKTPAISYEYGSSITTLSKRAQTQNLTQQVQGGGFAWDDFFPAARQAATVDGKVYGVPALIDNLALVYNKKLFDAAHLPYPTVSWTWDDFRAAAKKLTNPGAKQYGWAYVNDGTEDTVWRYIALLWQAGGDLLNANNTKAAFNSPAGLAALQLLSDMATTDHSVYLDQGDQSYQGLFNSGKIGMLWTGPWDLSGFDQVSYGVQILPGKVTHATIAGPDNWMVFGKSGEKTALAFLQWLDSPEIHLQFATDTGDLPLRGSEVKLPAYQQYISKYPANEVFMDNLASNTQKVRPNIPQYPKISEAIGQMVQSVLLGKARPGAALTATAAQVDQILAGS